MLIEERLQTAGIEIELVEKCRDVNCNDRPDDDWLMRPAYVVAKGKQVRLSFGLSSGMWE